MTDKEIKEALEEGELEKVSESYLYDMYDDFLDEVSPPIKIGVLTYSPSEVLKSVDPTAYRTGFNDFLDSEGIIEDSHGNLYRRV